MNDWVKDGVPVFAVVGKINMGKSSVLATLLEIDSQQVLRVSSTPGETTRCQVLPLAYEGRECMRFVDTPGFSRPLEAMKLIQEIHGEGVPDLKAVKTFVERELDGGEFEDEARLLEPVVQGAGVLYVVDPGKPLRDAFVAEMEIMRWTGRPRLALLNVREGSMEGVEEWKTRLGSYFNLVRTFNAHRARFSERRRLLKSLLEIEENHREQIEKTIDLLDEEWRQRRGESAEVIMELLGKALAYREQGKIEEGDREMEHRRAKKVSELGQRYFQKIARMEEKACGKLLEIYRHQLVEVAVDDDDFHGLDLSEEETWQKWGLSRGQLTLAGGVVGGAAGVTVDLGSGGLTHGAGTVIGGLIGASAAFFRGKDLPDLKLAATGSGSAEMLVMGPPKNENFPWILLDRMLQHYHVMVSRSHGRRDKEVIEGEETGWVKRFPRERRMKLQKWFVKCGKKGEMEFSSEIYELVKESLVEVEEH